MRLQLLMHLYHDFNLVFNVKSNQDCRLVECIFTAILQFHNIETSKEADDSDIDLPDLLVEFFNAEKIPEFYKFEELMNKYAVVRKPEKKPRGKTIQDMMHNVVKGTVFKYTADPNTGQNEYHVIEGGHGYAGIPPIQNLDKL